jgi:hypothetical protein
MAEWSFYKEAALKQFKTDHAADMNNAHVDVTRFPVKFELGLSPALKSLASAKKSNKATDIEKYKKKGLTAYNAYRQRIDASTTKKELGKAWTYLDAGLKEVHKLLQ